MNVQATSGTARNTQIRAVLDHTSEQLRNVGHPEPRHHAETLVAHVAGCPRLELPLHYERPLAARVRGELRQKLDDLVKRRPLQYVMGTCSFRQLELNVDERALIPRPETEGLVDLVLEQHELWKADELDLVDVCTGSGCIALALACERPQAKVTALDVDAVALSLAMENGHSLGLGERVTFLESDALAVIPNASVDAIVSNPPYVTTAEWAGLPAHIKDFEPRLALDGGELGLDLISRLVPDALRALKSGGYLFMEIGADQAAAVERLYEAAGFDAVSVHKDLAGKDRMVMGKKQ